MLKLHNGLMRRTDSLTAAVRSVCLAAPASEPNIALNLGFREQEHQLFDAHPQTLRHPINLQNPGWHRGAMAQRRVWSE